MDPTYKNAELVHIVDEDANGIWNETVSTLNAALQGGGTALKHRRLRLIFGSSTAVRSCTSLQHANFPDQFWQVVMKDLNGCFRCDYREDGDRGLTTYDSWSCFKIKHVAGAKGAPGIVYKWTQMTMFIRWDLIGCQHLIFLLDCPDDLKRRLPYLLPSTANRSPYTWHAIFVREAQQLYDSSIWALRDLVREVEKSRNASAGFDFPQFHDLARHIIHSNETLQIAERTVQSVINEQTRSRKQLCSDIPRTYEREHREMSFMLDELYALKTRSLSLNERLQNEIGLAFNIVSQTHSRSAQSDSAVMKTIGIVSLVYLPGMFISSIFGMNFFGQRDDQGGRTLTVSQDFWLYWGITLPLTAATVVVWAMWHYSVDIMRVLKQLSRK